MGIFTKSYLTPLILSFVIVIDDILGHISKYIFIFNKRNLIFLNVKSLMLI